MTEGPVPPVSPGPAALLATPPAFPAPGPAPVLAEGPRTTLHALRHEDGPAFVARVRASRALHHPWLSMPADANAFAAYADRLAEPERAGFLLRTRADDAVAGGARTGGVGAGGATTGGAVAGGTLAGFVNINNIVHGAFRCGALGYGAFAGAEGRGLMTEGLGLVIRYAFTALGLHRLEINVQPENTASCALARRLGFRHEGYSPDFLYVDGAWHGHERFALTSEMVSAVA
ncbi:GNAT family N-acetyltransferase [Streptomyces sp. CA-253872]|uniref:GNAT family N-acetyltransferase n=1 Tax=Streptomyces sp. CA-253872 TaxID=3240067 RepID=UPI003D948801